MRLSNFVCLSLLSLVMLTGNQAVAKSTCKDDQFGSAGSVVVLDEQNIVVAGLKEKGIKSGTYTCRVLGVGPGLLSTQSQLACERTNSAGEPTSKLSAWMIEGLDLFGHQAASVALYDESGSKIFESPCGRD